jgi:hypothetical protein
MSHLCDWRLWSGKFRTEEPSRIALTLFELSSVIKMNYTNIDNADQDSGVGEAIYLKDERKCQLWRNIFLLNVR